MAETIQVYDREFELDKPKTKHYLSLLRFVKRLIKDGYGDKLEEIAQAEDMGGIEVLFEIVDTVEEKHLTHFAAVLLQDDVEETIAFVEKNGGVELGWLAEAFAVNCELADLGQVIDQFRRAFKAIRSWSEG